MDITQQVIDIQTADGPMAAPWAQPATGGPRPGVVVVMEAFGVNANITGITARFAEQGYVAVAPDLFHRAGRLRYAPYDKLQEMRAELRVGFSDASIDADIQATIDCLHADPGVSGAVGIVGFCLGGRIALQSAVRARGLSAAALYYGGFMFPGDDQPEAFSALAESPNLDIPIVGFFGNDDRNPTPEQAHALDDRLTALGKDHRFHYYDGAAHGFFCDDRPSHHPQTAADSWEKTLAFFAQTLQ